MIVRRFANTNIYKNLQEKQGITDNDGTVSYKPAEETTFDIPYLEDFYTPALITLYFDGIRIAEAVFIEYVYNDQKIPVYGYGDRYVRAFEEGHHLISGRMGFLFKETAYLSSVIDLVSGSRLITTPGGEGAVYALLQRVLSDPEVNEKVEYMRQILTSVFGLEPFKVGQLNANQMINLLKIYKSVIYMTVNPRYGATGPLVTQAMNSSEALSSPSSPLVWKIGSPHVISAMLDMEDVFGEVAIEGLWESVEDALWSKEVPGLDIAPIVEHDLGYTGYGYVISDKTFDVFIRYGADGSSITDHTVEVINDVHLVSSGKSINVGSPDLVVEVLEFIARTNNRRLNIYQHRQVSETDELISPKADDQPPARAKKYFNYKKSNMENDRVKEVEGNFHYAGPELAEQNVFLTKEEKEMKADLCGECIDERCVIMWKDGGGYSVGTKKDILFSNTGLEFDVAYRGTGHFGPIIIYEKAISHYDIEHTVDKLLENIANISASAPRDAGDFPLEQGLIAYVWHATEATDEGGRDYFICPFGVLEQAVKYLKPDFCVRYFNALLKYNTPPSTVIEDLRNAMDLAAARVGFTNAEFPIAIAMAGHPSEFLKDIMAYARGVKKPEFDVYDGLKINVKRATLKIVEGASMTLGILDIPMYFITINLADRESVLNFKNKLDIWTFHHYYY